MQRLGREKHSPQRHIDSDVTVSHYGQVVNSQTGPVTLKLLLRGVSYLLKLVFLFPTQRMFRAEDIVSENCQQQDHVYNLLVALRNLSTNKRRRQDAKASTQLAPQPVTDKGISYSAIILDRR